MLPPQVVLILSILAGLAALTLAVRLMLRWWRTSPSVVSSIPETSAISPVEAVRTSDPDSVPISTAAAEPITASSPLTGPESAAPLVGLTILKPGFAPSASSSAVTTSTATEMAAAEVHASSAAPATGEWSPPKWADGPLLGKPSNAGLQLPRLLSEDVDVSRKDDYVFGSVTPVLAAFLPESGTRFDQARKELHAAGYYQPHALQNLAAIRYLLMMGGLVLAGLLLLIVPQRIEWIAMLALLGLPLLGWALPRLYLLSQGAERRSQIERGMPDLLDMLNMCVSQGLTIPDALRRILGDLQAPYPALTQELRIVNEQARIGGMQLALENFSHRVDVPEVHSFASLLSQTERMGTSISDALTSYSDSMRESLKQRADEKGNRATFRLLFPTVLCLMPAVYLFLLGPAIVELSNFFASGGRDSLDQGSAVIQRINESRGVPGPLDSAR